MSSDFTLLDSCLTYAFLVDFKMVMMAVIVVLASLHHGHKVGDPHKYLYRELIVPINESKGQ